MRKFVTIDDSKYPIVITRYQKFDPTPEEFRQMQLDLEVYSASHSDFVMIIDLTDLSFLPAEMRISQAKWSKQMDPLFVKQRMKAVFCTPSSIGQIMLKGVFLLAKPGVPYAVVGSINEGVSWAQKQLNGTKPGNTVYS